MDRRKGICALCAVAFVVVLLHSAIPHCHHCSSIEAHLHKILNCELLNTYLSQHEEDFAASLSVFIDPEPCIIPGRPDSRPESIDCNPLFSAITSDSFFSCGSRAPPATV